MDCGATSTHAATHVHRVHPLKLPRLFLCICRERLPLLLEPWERRNRRPQSQQEEETSPSAVTKEAPPKTAARGKESPEMSLDERVKLFQKAFPGFGKEEFQLANDDLYPDWKKNIAPNGTWPEFLGVYREFVQWWTDQGSPPETGSKLWKDFLTSRGKR